MNEYGDIKKGGLDVYVCGPPDFPRCVLTQDMISCAPCFVYLLHSVPANALFESN